MELFHGGCHGCTMQEKNGVEYCKGCQYFEADWSLPDLNNTHIEKEEEGFTKKELVVMLRIICEEAQRYSNKGQTPPKEVYSIRYKLRDILKSR